MFQMRFKVRIQGPISSMGEWPEPLQRQLVPYTFVPVPPCDKSVVTPTNDPKTCKPYTAPPTPLTPTTLYPSNTTGKKHLFN